MGHSTLPTKGKISGAGVLNERMSILASVAERKFR